MKIRVIYQVSGMITKEDVIISDKKISIKEILDKVVGSRFVNFKLISKKSEKKAYGLDKYEEPILLVWW